MKLETFFEKFELFADAPDAVAKMRELVLEWAMQGRLVPQNPQEETAQALLNRIGSTAKRRRRAWDESSSAGVPFPIPQTWEWVRLPRVLRKLTDGTHHSPPNGPSGPFMYITAKNIKTDGVSLDNITYVSQDVHNEIYSRCDPSFGDLLYIKDGATTGIATINQIREPFSLLSSVALLKPSEAIFNRYLLWTMRSPFFYAETRGAMKGAAITRVTLSVMAESLLPLPPLAEQKRIVAKVDELMALCDRLEAQQQERETRHAALASASLARFAEAPTPTNLEFLFHNAFAISPPDLRKSILTLAVQGKLVPQRAGDEPARDQLARISALKSMPRTNGKSRKVSSKEIFWDFGSLDLPGGWVATSLSDLVAVCNGRAYAKDELLSEGVPVLRVGNLFTNNHWYYSNLKLDPEKYCDEGDLIYAWSASFGPFIWQGPRAIYHYHIWKLVPHSEADIDRRFLYWMLQERTQAIKDAGHGVSMTHMTKEKMEVLPVMLPPLAEQRRIVAKVDELMALVDKLEAELVAARNTAADLLSAAVAELTRGKQHHIAADSKSAAEELAVA